MSHRFQASVLAILVFVVGLFPSAALAASNGSLTQGSINTLAKCQKQQKEYKFEIAKNALPDPAWEKKVEQFVTDWTKHVKKMDDAGKITDQLNALFESYSTSIQKVSDAREANDASWEAFVDVLCTDDETVWNDAHDALMKTYAALILVQKEYVAWYDTNWNEFKIMVPRKHHNKFFIQPARNMKKQIKSYEKGN